MRSASKSFESLSSRYGGKAGPAGHDIAVRGTSGLTIDNGKITRRLYIWDVAGILRSTGLLPEH
jgi:hypothetical protein